MKLERLQLRHSILGIAYLLFPQEAGRALFSYRRRKIFVDGNEERILRGRRENYLPRCNSGNSRLVLNNGTGAVSLQNNLWCCIFNSLAVSFWLPLSHVLLHGSKSGYKNMTKRRHLLKRIEEPMKQFESNQNVLAGKDAKRIIKVRI